MLVSATTREPLMIFDITTRPQRFVATALVVGVLGGSLASVTAFIPGSPAASSDAAAAAPVHNIHVKALAQGGTATASNR